MKALLALFLVGLIGATGVAAARTPGEVAVGDALRNATMQGLNGPSRALSHYKGLPMVINVWASWCAPCRQEMPSLERLSQRKGGRPFVVIGISTDDYPEAAKGFLKKSSTTFSHFIDQQLELENMLGADRLPLTLLIDAQGRVIAKFYGSKSWDSPESLALIDKAFH